MHCLFSSLWDVRMECSPRCILRLLLISISLVERNGSQTLPKRHGHVVWDAFGNFFWEVKANTSRGKVGMAYLLRAVLGASLWGQVGNSQFWERGWRESRLGRVGEPILPSSDK
jgi:hypothetical protein